MAKSSIMIQHSCRPVQWCYNSTMNWHSYGKEAVLGDAPVRYLQLHREKYSLQGKGKAHSSIQRGANLYRKKSQGHASTFPFHLLFPHRPSTQIPKVPIRFATREAMGGNSTSSANTLNCLQGPLFSAQ